MLVQYSRRKGNISRKSVTYNSFKSTLGIGMFMLSVKEISNLPTRPK